MEDNLSREKEKAVFLLAAVIILNVGIHKICSIRVVVMCHGSKLLFWKNVGKSRGSGV